MIDPNSSLLDALHSGLEKAKADTALMAQVVKALSEKNVPLLNIETGGEFSAAKVYLDVRRLPTNLRELLFSVLPSLPLVALDNGTPPVRIFPAEFVTDNDREGCAVSALFPAVSRTDIKGSAQKDYIRWWTRLTPGTVLEVNLDAWEVQPEAYLEIFEGWKVKNGSSGRGKDDGGFTLFHVVEQQS